MKKSFLLIAIIILSVLLTGCQSKIVCNEPYILVGTECCLDKDNNSICDRDEKIEDFQNKTSELKNDESLNTPQNIIPPNTNNKIFDNSYALIIELKDITEPGFTITERFTLNSENIGSEFNLLSKSKLKSLEFQNGYKISFLKESEPQKSIDQYVMIFNNSDKATTFFNDRKEYYLTNFELRTYKNKHNFDQIEYLVSEDPADVNYYRFLIRKDNAVIGLLVIVDPSKILDEGEFDELLEQINELVKNNDVTKTLPSEIRIPSKGRIGSSPYPFPDEIKSTSLNGFNTGLLNYTFEKKGDDWGKLNKITLVIDNENGADIYPYVTVRIYDRLSGSIANMPVKEIEVGEWIYTGNYLLVTLDVDLTFAKINNEKLLKISIEDFDNTAINFDVPITFVKE